MLSHESSQVPRFWDNSLKVFSFRYFCLRVYVYICVSVCHTDRSACRGQKSILGLPYHKPARVGAGAKLWSPARAASAVLSPTEPYLPPALGFKLKNISPVYYQFIEEIRLTIAVQKNVSLCLRVKFSERIQTQQPREPLCPDATYLFWAGWEWICHFSPDSISVLQPACCKWLDR